MINNFLVNGSLNLNCPKINNGIQKYWPLRVFDGSRLMMGCNDSFGEVW